MNIIPKDSIIYITPRDSKGMNITPGDSIIYINPDNSKGMNIEWIEFVKRTFDKNKRMILFYTNSECNYERLQSSGGSLGSLLATSSSLFGGRLGRGFGYLNHLC